MNSLLTNVSARNLRQAAAIRERIEDLERELSRVLGSPSTGSSRWGSASSGRGPGRRKMSAAAKARLAEIARARWKKAKASGRSHL
jgi:hypothetical protein